MIFLPLPSCPKCGESRPTIVRSMPKESDGSYSRRCMCRKCSTRFVVVFESPENLPTIGRDGFAVGRIEETINSQFGE